jgi:phage gpG-like protein
MPDAAATIEIEGLDELIRKLDNLSKLKAVHTGLQAAATHIKGMMTVYPPETIANSPSNPSGQWYQRGWGVRYKGGGGRPISEQLDKKWTMKYNKSRFEAIVGNNASYARFVQGPKGTQAKAMARIGWKGVDTVAKEETKRVQEYVFEAVRRAINAA